MTVKPPPATAPLMMAYFAPSLRLFTWLVQECDQRVVIEGGQRGSSQMHGPVAQTTAQHGFQPPRLQPTMNDQAREEETNHERPAEIEFRLVVPCSLNHPHEEEESANKHRGVMRRHHRPQQEEKVTDGDPSGHFHIIVHPAHFSFRVFLLSFSANAFTFMSASCLRKMRK